MNTASKHYTNLKLAITIQQMPGAWNTPYVTNKVEENSTRVNSKFVNDVTNFRYTFFYLFHGCDGLVYISGSGIRPIILNKCFRQRTANC